MIADEIYDLTTANRLMIAELLDGLDDAQWRSRTLCEAWTVHEMAAHFVQPMLIGFGRFLRASLRYRGNTDRTIEPFIDRLQRDLRVLAGRDDGPHG